MKFRARNLDYHNEAVDRERNGKVEEMEKSVLLIRFGVYEKHRSRRANSTKTSPMQQQSRPSALHTMKMDKEITYVTHREEPKRLQHTSGFVSLILLRIKTETRTKRLSNRTWLDLERERERAAANYFIYRMSDESVLSRCSRVEIELETQTQATRANRKPSPHHQLTPDTLKPDLSRIHEIMTSSLPKSANAGTKSDGDDHTGPTNAIVPYVPIPNYLEPTTAIVPYLPRLNRHTSGRDQQLTRELAIWAQVARIAIQTIRPNPNKSGSPQGANGQEYGRKRNSQVSFFAEIGAPTSDMEPRSMTTQADDTEDRPSQHVNLTDNEDIHHLRPAKKQKQEIVTKMDKTARKKAKKERREKRRSERSQTAVSQTKKPRSQSTISIPGAKFSTDAGIRLDRSEAESCSPPLKRKSLFSPENKRVQGPRLKERDLAPTLFDTHTEYAEVEAKPKTAEKPVPSVLGNSSSRQNPVNFPRATSRNNSNIDALGLESNWSSGLQMKKPNQVNPPEKINVQPMKRADDVASGTGDVSEGSGDLEGYSGIPSAVVAKNQCRNKKRPVLSRPPKSENAIDKSEAQGCKNRRYSGQRVCQVGSVEPAKDLLPKQDNKIHGLWGGAKTLSETKGNRRNTDRDDHAQDEEAIATAPSAVKASEKEAGPKRLARPPVSGLFANTDLFRAKTSAKTPFGMYDQEKPIQTAQGKVEGISSDQRYGVSQSRTDSNGVAVKRDPKHQASLFPTFASRASHSQKQTQPEGSEYYSEVDSKVNGNRQATAVQPSNGSHFKLLLQDELPLSVEEPKREQGAQIPIRNNAPTTTKGKNPMRNNAPTAAKEQSTHARSLCLQPSGETTEQRIESNREACVSTNREETYPKDASLFCTEQFLEDWGDLVSILGSGRWAESQTTSANTYGQNHLGRKVILIDTVLMKQTGVDIELPGRCGVQVFSASALNSTTNAKAAVLHIARLAAIGRYSHLYLYIFLDSPLSRELSKHLVQLQCAGVKAKGLPETKVSVQTMLCEHLPGAMAQTIFRHVDSSPRRGTHDSLMQLVSNRTTVSRTFVLQSLVPLFSMNGALEVLEMAQTIHPDGCPFQMLFGNQQTLQRIMLKSSSEEKSSIHPNAIRQLFQVVTKTGTNPA